MPAPSWLLLAWVGLAATCAAAIVGSVIDGRTRHAWSLRAQPRSRADALRFTVLLGLLLYPLVYGIIFEVFARSDVLFGFGIGFVHGVAAFLFSGPRSALTAALRVFLMHVAYGGIIAFLYVTP